MGLYRRFFALPHEKEGDYIHLKSEYNHLAKVLRAKIGDEVIVSFDDGIDHLSRIEKITADEVLLKISDTFVNPCESKKDVTLFQGVIKGNGMDWAVEKAVELGVNRIRPFVSRYSVAECNANKAERLTKIAHEASKQCGRARLVNVDVAIGFDQMLSELRQYEQVIFCCEKGGLPLIDAVDLTKNKIAVIVGSEGGFSQNEIDSLSNKADTVSLGERILRAETAGIYTLAIIDGLVNKK